MELCEGAFRRRFWRAAVPPFGGEAESAKPTSLLAGWFLGERFIAALSVALRASANDFADERDMRFGFGCDSRLFEGVIPGGW